MGFITLLGLAAAVVLGSTAMANAQEQSHPAAQASVPLRDMTYIAPDGTAYITRVIPLPKTVSPEAQNHAFWTNPTLPESDEAYHIAVKFFQQHLRAVGSQAHAQHD